ncbi:MAG: hypothetical protein ACJ8M1_04980 [Chthoniobacterales bacterium]
MDPEPKRPIEKMLEASAEARRAAFGAAPSMPNPMRARLHDEITRLDRAENAGSRMSWLQLFWPRLGVAAALATVLVVGSAMWWRGTHDSSGGRMQMAAAPGIANETRKAAAPPNETFAKGPAVAAATAPDVSLGDNSRARLEPEQTRAAVASADSMSNHPTFSAQPNPTVPAAMAKGLVSKSEKAAGETAVAGAGPAAAGALAESDETSSTREARMADQDSAVHKQLAARAAPSRGAAQQFRQVSSQSFRNNVQSQRGSNILNDFQVQQQGDEIRVVDSDGSTYTGQVERESQLSPAPASIRAKHAAADRSAEEVKQDGAQTRFRASGYNLSLKKPVTFEGNLTQMSAPQSNASKSSANDGELQQGAARVVGVARIKDEPPVEVDAMAVGVQRAKQHQQ